MRHPGIEKMFAEFCATAAAVLATERARTDPGLARIHQDGGPAPLPAEDRDCLVSYCGRVTYTAHAAYWRAYQEALPKPAVLEAELSAAKARGQFDARLLLEHRNAYLMEEDDLPEAAAIAALMSWCGHFTPAMAAAFREEFNNTIRLLTGDR